MNRRILVVDDDPIITMLIATILERNGGYEVREENVATKTTEIAASFNPELVLLDIHMPWMGGFEVARALHEHPALATVPILFLASLMECESHLTPKWSEIHCIEKPFHAGELVAAVEKALKNGKKQPIK